MWVDAFETVGVDTAASRGTSIVGSGVANTKGTYVQLIAATSIVTAWFQALYGKQTGSSGTDEFLIDISLGAAASEVVLIANLQWSSTTPPVSAVSVQFPVAIASGVRIAARCQQSSTAVTDLLGIQLLLASRSSLTGDTAPATYGADVVDSGGTVVDAGAVANTKGAYVQLTASSAAIHNHLAVLFGNRENGFRQTAGFLFDIATGAAASEVVLAPDLQVETNASINESVVVPYSLGIPEVAAAVRYATRSQSSTTDATDRLLDVTIIGSNMAEPGGSGGGGGGGASMHLGHDGLVLA